jgi:signal recognition particle GTPase
MTKKERAKPEILDASRRRRIANRKRNKSWGLKPLYKAIWTNEKSYEGCVKWKKSIFNASEWKEMVLDKIFQLI